ncbi:hypothetical protein BD769DRAFT_537831 [Suillus cothurnatus]|nr:hypothetical protein BD769DRAFT_537831 [Suillus cothurnatus]
MTRSVSNFHPRIVWIILVVSEWKMRSSHAKTCSWTQLWSCTQVPTYVFLRKFLTMHRPLFTDIHHKLSYL